MPNLNMSYILISCFWLDLSLLRTMNREIAAELLPVEVLFTYSDSNRSQSRRTVDVSASFTTQPELVARSSSKHFLQA